MHSNRLNLRVFQLDRCRMPLIFKDVLNGTFCSQGTETPILAMLISDSGELITDSGEARKLIDLTPDSVIKLLDQNR